MIRKLLAACSFLAFLGCSRPDGPPGGTAARDDLDGHFNARIADLMTAPEITTGAWDGEVPPSLSPNKKWVTYAKRGTVYVRKADGNNKGVKVIGTIRTIGLFWGPSKRNSTLIINNYRVSNQTTCHAFTPEDGKLVDVSAGAFETFDPEDEFGSIHAVAIACSPDNQQALLKVIGWADRGRSGYYCVSTADGRVMRSFTSARDIPYLWWKRRPPTSPPPAARRRRS